MKSLGPLSALVLSLSVCLPSAAIAEQPSIDDLAWLAGRWQGEAFGGTFEETWNPPSGGTMVGLFKLLRDGDVAMYELQRIAEVDGRLVLEVKHFSADFTAWEAKDEAVRFPLEHVAQDVIAFEGLVFRRRENGTLEADLAMRDGESGEIRTERLVYLPID